MAKSQQLFKSHDNTEIVYFKHTPEVEKKGIVIITHGMAEHAQRYDDFANFLNAKGFIVYAHDQRGHGKTAGSVDKLGFFANENGWQKVSDDLGELIKLAKTENQNLPIFLFGHSMGSFITRTYIINNSEKINGVILSGTAGSAGLLGKIGLLITNIIMLFNKKDAASPLLDKLSFGDFNKAFKPNRTKFDWLSRDEKQVDKYVEDPYCGTVFSVGFFNDMMKGLELVNKADTINKIRKDLPIYLFSGSNDPVSKNGKQVKDVFDMYKNKGISDISIKLYENARHETLNEINNKDVYNDVLNWLELKLKS